MNFKATIPDNVKEGHWDPQMEISANRNILIISVCKR